MNETDLTDVDRAVSTLIRLERERQERKLILIPSESICHQAVLQALDSPFSNIYAEGYPWRESLDEEEDALVDLAFQEARHRRYYDRRFYKGCDYANLVEALASRRVRGLFATDTTPAGRIFANVQPLSGAAANNAVYTALLEPGDVIMGMSLMHGGHLTHGSEFNRSGRTYRAVAYEVSPETERLDYDRIQKRAEEHRPRLIVAGYTSYPWTPDWKRFREIADGVGAYLLADVAHPAGMIAAGVYPNPIDYADVVTFTTHKTLFGPRGAVILSTRGEIAERIDKAVFPGEQGGPHVNVFAALAVAFLIAGTEGFRAVQRSIVENARTLAESLVRNGLTLAYGGTDTHLLVLDLRSLKTKSSRPLKGDTAVRMLDLAGIVANKNTIPGDDITAEASGVRMGTPWITQRGISTEGIDELASTIADLLGAVHPFSYRGISGPLPRGKIALEDLEGARRRVDGIVEGLESAEGAGRRKKGGGAPAGAARGSNDVRTSGSRDSAASRPLTLLVRGERAAPFCDQVGTGPAAALEAGSSAPTLLLAGDGRLIAPAVCSRLVRDARGMDRFLLTLNGESAGTVVPWLEGLSDGYLLFDDGDVYRKIEGPVAVGDGGPLLDGAMRTRTEAILSSLSRFSPGMEAKDLLRDAPEAFDLSKPYFVGRPRAVPADRGRVGIVPPASAEGAPPLPSEARPSFLYEEHLGLTKHIVDFAGWLMPVRYEGILEEHGAVRERAALFDVTHMGVLEISGEKAERFLDFVFTNYVPWMKDGDSQYGYFLDDEGSVVDDVMVYRFDRKRYLLVVNAANAEKDLDWLRAVNERACADAASRPEDGPPSPAGRPNAAPDGRSTGPLPPGPVTIRDLKDPSSGKDRLVDIALQGPASTSILKSVAGSPVSSRSIDRLQKTRFTVVEVAGVAAVVSRTGYTGEECGFEILVHPDEAPRVWRALLESGGAFGIKPAGLGARDSLRVEAGLPLYGHELAGQYGITPIEAGFGSYVKFHKPFFIGREALLARERGSNMTVVRFRKSAAGMRMSKPGDRVISRRTAKVIGAVTSCAVDREGIQVGMAYVESGQAREGNRIGILPAASRPEASPGKETGGRRGISGGPAPVPDIGRSVPVPDDAVVMSRFMKQDGGSL